MSDVEEDAPRGKRQRTEGSVSDAAARKQRREAEKGALSAITGPMRRRDYNQCGAALKSALEKGFNVPPSTVAGVLHQFDLCQKYQEGIAFYQSAIERVYPKANHETISTVLLRMQCRSIDNIEQLKVQVSEVAKRLHEQGELRRRLFSEPLKQFHVKAKESSAIAAQTAEAAYALYGIGNAYQIEFWDEDILSMVSTFRSAGRRDYVAEVMETSLTHYHPVVGRLLAAELCGSLLGSTGESSSCEDRVVKVGEGGMCPRCNTQLKAFDFSDDDRKALLTDIETRLVLPSLRLYASTGSHRGLKTPREDERYITKADPPTAEEMRPFDAYKQLVAQACHPLPPEYTAVCILDGANIGYFNVAAWYKTAKKEVLRAKGVDPDTVHAKELDPQSRKGRAMDVPLNFGAIDAAINSAVERKWFPLVVLHERHLVAASMTPRNQGYLDKWAATAKERERPLVLPSPASLNDDFAWLYSAVEHRCFVITNDLMRDHHYATLSRRTFLRWRGTFRVPFSCYWPTKSMLFQTLDGLVFSLSKPPRFSRWIQSSSSATAESVWHIPFYEHLGVVNQSTNEVKSEEEQQKASEQAEAVSWICMGSCS